MFQQHHWLGESVCELVTPEDSSETTNSLDDKKDASPNGGLGDKKQASYIIPIVIGCAVLVIVGIIFFVIKSNNNSTKLVNKYI